MSIYKTAEVTVNKSAKDFFNQISDLNNLRDIMPEQIQNFKSTKSTCSLKFGSLPEIKLEITEKIEFSKLSLTAKESQIPFSLNCFISENKNKCNVRVEIDVELNFMTRLVAEGPINQILQTIENKLENI